jgi:hypothetical protein
VGKAQKRLIASLVSLLTPALIFIAVPVAPVQARQAACMGCSEQCPTATCAQLGCPDDEGPPDCPSQNGSCPGTLKPWDCGLAA